MKKKQGAGLIIFIILINLVKNLHADFSASPNKRNSTVEQRWYRKKAPKNLQGPSPRVQLLHRDNYVILDNGIVQVSILSPEGSVTGIKYNGIANLLEELNNETDRGYWDLVWKGPSITRKKGKLDRLQCTDLKIIVETDEKVEVSFTRTWNPSFFGKLAPLNIDKRYIMLRGSSGFYTYAIYNHPKGWPAFTLSNTRLAFKLNKVWFKYMAMADKIQRKMPLPDDRSPERSQRLDYPEAVVLTNPIEPEFKGEVDDKYQYSGEAQDIQVHGWICSDPPTGLWQITPSNEFRSGGPTKQFLTSHVGPASLTVLLSTHYSGTDLMATFEEGEAWNKVMGPLFVYVNSMPKGVNWHQLWEDAKQQVKIESDSWPYDFAVSDDFPSSNERGNVYGNLMVYDRYLKTKEWARGAYVGLAIPGEIGSWQKESKGYQFWTVADDKGHFIINNIRAGGYDLYAWVPGFIGDYKSPATLHITAGNMVYLGNLIYEPPRDGPTLWEIGVPDRSAAEFFIPDPNPKLVNKLFLNQDRFRQYGLWDRYADLYPNEDLVYTININNYKKDWFFAQVTRKINNTYQGTTWQIKFQLDKISIHGTYHLRLAIASSTSAALEVRVNDRHENPPLFSSGVMGHDNTVARHGIHGLYWLYNVSLQGNKFVVGSNTIFLTQPMGFFPWIGIFYDYIRLEAPPN